MLLNVRRCSLLIVRLVIDRAMISRQIVAEDFWRLMLNVYCANFVMLDEIVFSVGNSFAVQDHLQASFSWALEAGTYHSLRLQTQSELLPPIDQRCLLRPTASMPSTLDLSLAGGPMLLSVFACTLAIFFFLYDEVQRARTSVAEKRRHGSGHLTLQDKMFHTPSLAERTIHHASVPQGKEAHWRLGGVTGQVLSRRARAAHYAAPTRRAAGKHRMICHVTPSRAAVGGEEESVMPFAHAD
jgi:hypothetical protein